MTSQDHVGKLNRAQNVHSAETTGLPRESQDVPRLTILGPDSAPLSAFLDAPEVTVGRAPGNNLVLHESRVSRCHARFFRGEASWLIEDLGSRHGTYLNGRRLERPEVVEPGDRIGIGELTLVFDPPPELALEHLTPGTGQFGHGHEQLLVGESAVMADVRRLVGRFAPSMATVLVHGETGTGKEIVARFLHATSERADGPFVIVNCPALPGGLVEAELFGTEKGVATGVEGRCGLVETADGGTLFLDEVGDLELSAQAKLLRFLQDGSLQRVGSRKTQQLDVRVVAATHHELPRLVDDGRFRRDLYHRLEMATIELPALRQRLEDVPDLVHHFLNLHGAASVGLSREALAVLQCHAYPGNVRELEHALQRALLLADGGVIRPEDLPRLLRESVAMSNEARPDPAADLHSRVVGAGESFWTAVRDPYLARVLTKEEARSFLARVHSEAGGSLKDTARLLRVEDQYRKFVDFLRNHDLRPDGAA